MKAVWGETGTLTSAPWTKETQKWILPHAKLHIQWPRTFLVMCVICESDTRLIKRIWIFVTYILPFGKKQKAKQTNTTTQCKASLCSWDGLRNKWIVRRLLKYHPFCVYVCKSKHRFTTTVSQYLCNISLKMKWKPAKIQRVSETRWSRASIVSRPFQIFFNQL